MKKFLIVILGIVIIGLYAAGMAHAESMEETKARIKAEVQQEMGITQPAPARSVSREKGYVRSNEEILVHGILILVVLAMIPATIAKVKGRSFVAWWFLGILFFIIVFPISVYMKKLPGEQHG